MEKHLFNGDDFHSRVKKVYFGETGPVIYKKAAEIAVVEYPVLHHNPAETGIRAGGGGKAVSRWIFSEDNGQAEGLSSTDFNLMIDFSLEPGACMGLHLHHDKEEFYYILAGSITLTTVDTDSREYTEELHTGDAHMTRLGQGHYGQAGPEGVRILTVCVNRKSS